MIYASTTGGRKCAMRGYKVRNAVEKVYSATQTICGLKGFIAYAWKCL